MKVDGKPSPILLLFFFTVLVTAVRVFFAANLELSPDEAYYWRWSLEPAWHYPDHPPLIAWLIHMGTAIIGTTALGVRTGVILASVCAVFLVYSIGHSVGLGKKDSALAASLSSILPLPATGALIATPDTFLGLIWLVIIYGLVRLVTVPSAFPWYIIGAALGMGLLTKHSALLIPPLVALSIFFVPGLRPRLRSIHPWFSVVLAGIIALPYFYFEANTGFLSVRFQLAHLGGRLVPEHSTFEIVAILQRVGELLLGQFGLLTPVVSILIIASYTRLRNHPKRLVLALGFLVPLGASVLSAIFTHPEQNWAALGHPVAAISLMLLLGDTTAPNDSVFSPHAKAWLKVAFVTTLGITTIIHLHALHPFLPLPASSDPVSRLHGWGQLKPLENHIDSVDSIICDNYGLAAEIAWHWPTNSTANLARSVDRQQVSWKGRLLVLDELDDWGQSSVKFDCKEHISLPPLLFKSRSGQRMRTVTVSVVDNCKTMNK
jgi:4-amino-4-deoxy-L-arabinose transferase-like glycosyltransferase